MDIKDTLGKVSTSTLMSLDLQQTSGWIVDVNVTIFFLNRDVCNWVLLVLCFIQQLNDFEEKKYVFYTRRSRPNPVELVTLTSLFSFK